MYRGRIGVLLVALVVALAACGPRSAASPSPSSAPSPSYAPLVIASMPLKAGEVGLSYGGATFEATGGVHPYMYQVTEGALPGGLTLSRDGVVSGSPTTVGDFSFTVQVVDSGGQANSAQDSIDIVPALQLSSLKSGTIYVESGCDTVCGGFATQTGGQAPYSYAVKSGNLPPGTSLSGTSLAGKFSSTGNYSFTVEATDALGATAPVAATFSIFPHIYFYCPSTWPGGPGGCIPPGGNGAYRGGLTFQCTQVASHPDCTGMMPFAGGSASGWTVRYQVVAGSQPPAGSGFGVPDPQASPPPPFTAVSFTMVEPPTSGATAYGTLLVTISDSMACGPGASTRCSASAYMTYTVQNRS
jgi:putative Ig domain-containing protein